MQVYFGHCLEARFKRFETLKTVKCNSDFETDRFIGYKIFGLTNTNHESVTIGLRICDGVIKGYGYFVGNDWNGVELLEDCFLADLEWIFDKLVVLLATDKNLGPPDLMQRRCEEVQKALVNSKKALVNEQLPRVVGLKSVLLKTDFGKVWCRALVGWYNSTWVIALVDWQYGAVQSVFEWHSTNRSELVRIWNTIRGSERVSKKGNKWYCIEPEFFSKFFRQVSGEVFYL